MTDVTKDLQRVASQAKAPILDEITEASGQGALTLGADTAETHDC